MTVSIPMQYLHVAVQAWWCSIISASTSISRFLTTAVVISPLEYFCLVSVNKCPQTEACGTSLANLLELIVILEEECEVLVGHVNIDIGACCEYMSCVCHVCE